MLERLSEDLTVLYGKGFSIVNLTRMRLFFTAFPIFSTLKELSWSHYHILSRIEDSEKRDAYEKKAINAGWSVRELSARLKLDAVRKIPENIPVKYVSTQKIESISFLPACLPVRQASPTNPTPTPSPPGGQFLNQELLNSGVVKRVKS